MHGNMVEMDLTQKNHAHAQISAACARPLLTAWDPSA
jgi:hypothetical protein